MANLAGDTSLQSEVLEELSQARNYRRWLAGLAGPYLGADPIEIGSGVGDYAQEWAEGVESLTATEADEKRFRALRNRFADHPVISTRWLLLGAPPDPTPADHRYSAAVAYNVLEHIPDDVAALRQVAALIRPAGALVLLVPAFQSAMSRFDRRIGHQRRYTRAGLTTTLRAADLHVEQVRYVNPIGLLSWYVAVKALGLTPRDGTALRVYDRVVVPVARALDRIPTPFGQSVFAVARVPRDL